jgi:outer membrane protein
VTSPLFRDIGASAAAFQNIYDFGRTAHQVKASRWATVSLNQALEAQQALVALNVQQAYYTALGQQRLMKVAEQTLAERQLVARQASAFYKTEIKSKVDLTLAEVNASAANLELVKARDLLGTAFAEINHAMGVEGEAAYMLEEPDGRIESPPALEALLTESKRRTDLLALEAQINADDELIARARSDRWPRLMALFSSGWVRFSELSPGKLLLGAFGIDLPIFTGGRLEAEVAEAKANLEQTRAARDKLTQDIRLQIQSGHNELLTAIESVKASEHLVAQAREALRLAQVRYRVQIGSFVELTSAETAAANAEARHAEALYKCKMAEAVLNFAAGRRVTP